jgi:hypothetical protein
LGSGGKAAPRHGASTNALTTAAITTDEACRVFMAFPSV